MTYDDGFDHSPTPKLTADDKLAKALNKVRKGATAGLSAKQYTDVLSAVGFKVEPYRCTHGVRSKAYNITSPDGSSTYDLFKHHGQRNIVLYGGVEAWAKSHGLVDLVCVALGLDPVEVEAAKRKAAKNKAEHRATCPCCFGPFKYGADGDMVHHGYERPGHGYTVGKCAAARRFKPFEVSTAGTEYWLNEVVRPALVDAQHDVTRLAAGPDTVTEYHGYGQPKVHKAGTVHYRLELEAQLRTAKWNLESITRDVAILEAKLINWAPVALKGYPTV